MYNQEKKKTVRNVAMAMDLLHIVIGILVVVCAVLAFVNPEKNQFLFPVIFWLAALLNGVNGWYKIKGRKRDRKQLAGGIALCVTAGFLLLVGVLSAASIWR